MLMSNPSVSSSSLNTDVDYNYSRTDEVVSRLTPKFYFRQFNQDNRLSNVIIFIISLNDFNSCQLRKKYSVDIQLLSYSFLIDLINRTFHLHSNFTLVAKNSSSFKCNLPVTDDFDVDGFIMTMSEENDEQHQTIPEFIVYKYPRTKAQLKCDNEDWCFLDENYSYSNSKTSQYELIEIANDCILVTIKPKDNRQETFLQKATSWLHGSVNSSWNNRLTKKEFLQMLDPLTGRLLDEQSFRQRIYDTGCDESIRKIVWCYLLRVFNETMTNNEKNEYTFKTKERYNEMKEAWMHRYKNDDMEITALDNLIQKDVRRTDRSVKFFDDKENLSRQKLFNVLMTYSVYHPEPGYVQGMNDMAAVILYVMRDESLSYACFCALMRHMSSLFLPDGIAMKRRLDLLRKTIRAIDNDLWVKIEQCDIGKLMFAYRWLLLDCKREFPFKDIFSVFEILWASLPIDRFESNNNNNNNNTFSDRDNLCSSESFNQNRSSTISSLSRTCSLSRTGSLSLEDTLSQHSSHDGGDSGYRDENVSGICDLNIASQKYENPIYVLSQTNSSISSCLPLGKWLKDFCSIDDDDHYSDMFTIFLCVALLVQNRSSIMQITILNNDNDDFIGTYFTRLVRQHDARQALQLARNYHRQYVLFQMRLKQLLFTDK